MVLHIWEHTIVLSVGTAGTESEAGEHNAGGTTLGHRHEETGRVYRVWTLALWSTLPLAAGSWALLRIVDPWIEIPRP